MDNLKKYIFLIDSASLSMSKYGTLDFMWHRTKVLTRSSRIKSTSHTSTHLVSTGIFKWLARLYSLSEIVMCITKSNSVQSTAPHVVLKMSSIHSDPGVDTHRERRRGGGGRNYGGCQPRRSFFNQFPVRTRPELEVAFGPVPDSGHSWK